MLLLCCHLDGRVSKGVLSLSVQEQLSSRE